MPGINPRGCEQHKADGHSGIGSFKVVDDFDGGKTDITDIMSPKDGDANPGKVEAVGEEDEGDGRDVMDCEFKEVFAGFFELKGEDDDEVGPVCGLQQVE